MFSELVFVQPLRSAFDRITMANLLSIPFKKTYPIEIKEATRAYISHQGGAHPDEFKRDIKSWQDLRKDGVGGVVHENRVESSLL